MVETTILLFAGLTMFWAASGMRKRTAGVGRA